ncbi:uncharacterized protein CIMG_13316 [Coccidioides immitis RS]|uniref:Uncharacterized protein n=1 Tax=Coccidioides immitis (strain RS) TaxID=246410 RepID=A0A0D8JVE6_COCIM|nr:uncharacterized protein CIMG_13316 [Coccidioides immitis RS]KJF60911.1 hypothetical protein CIMG_13316 [Coccidioides immitis RS]
MLEYESTGQPSFNLTIPTRDPDSGAGCRKPIEILSSQWCQDRDVQTNRPGPCFMIPKDREKLGCRLAREAAGRSPEQSLDLRGIVTGFCNENDAFFKD